MIMRVRVPPSAQKSNCLILYVSVMTEQASTSTMNPALFGYTRFLQASEAYANSFVMQALDIARFCLENNITHDTLLKARDALLQDDKLLIGATQTAIKRHTSSGNAHAPLRIDLSDTRNVVNLDFSYGNLYMRQLSLADIRKVLEDIGDSKPDDEILKEALEQLMEARYRS